MAVAGIRTIWKALALIGCAATVTCGAGVSSASAGGAGEACSRADFESVVDAAGAALRDLNATKKPLFQDKLRVLKEKRGWTTDQFLKEAAPFVKDDRIDVWDEQSNELLERIASMGQEGSAAPTPDCALLTELRGYMKSLVATQTEKWTYMFGKLDTELAK